MDPRIYIGWRDCDGCRVYRIVQGKFSPLPPKLHIRNHSPAGFEWGYGGSGPSQLALALACDILEDANALEIYQELKLRIVGRLEHAAWILREDYLRLVICELFREEKTVAMIPFFRRTLRGHHFEDRVAPRDNPV